MNKEGGVKICEQTNYKVLYPTYTTISVKNLKNKVDFHPKEKWPCKNTWYRDLKSTHIRNKHLLDLQFSRPKCCSAIYNVVNDRQKVKKLQKYNLDRPVKTIIFGLEKEEIVKREPEDEAREETKITIFPECYILSESESDGNDDDPDPEYKICDSGSESECSGCSTLGGGTRKKRHIAVKKTSVDQTANKICSKLVPEELNRFKELKSLK